MPTVYLHVLIHTLSQVHGWEPAVMYEHVSVRWGKIADMAIYNEQLVSQCTILTQLASKAVKVCTVMYLKTGM